MKQIPHRPKRTIPQDDDFCEELLKPFATAESADKEVLTPQSESAEAPKAVHEADEIVSFDEEQTNGKGKRRASTRSDSAAKKRKLNEGPTESSEWLS